MPFDWAFNEIYGMDDDCLMMCIQPVLSVVASLNHKRKTGETYKTIKEREKGSLDHKAHFWMK